MTTKICSKCKEEKQFCEFYKNKLGVNGLHPSCKQCEILRKKIWRKNNPDKMDMARKSWSARNPNYKPKKNEEKQKLNREKNKEKKRLRDKLYYEKNKEKNREKESKRSAEYIKRNKEKHYAYLRKWRENKKKNDVLFKLNILIRSRVRKYLKLKNITKQNKTFDIVGCTPDFLREHIEKQFTSEMSWEKMGKEIHIDHIIPLSSAKTEEELFKLFHYTNLQPLWAEDNLKKSNKIYEIKKDCNN